MRAFVIVDLGFGDAGKGLLTDFLVRHYDAGLVVRYNGGAQAGHNVVTREGISHTFSQFGSGTFVPLVKTYLSRYVVVHPTALLAEGNVLEQKGVQDPYSRIRVSDQALVITPFHQAANHIREIARGSNRHGSCGVGVGEAVEDALSYPSDHIRAGDIQDKAVLARKLRAIREREWEQIAPLCRDFPNETARDIKIFETDEIMDDWITSVGRFNELGLVVPDLILERWLKETDNVIFEGAQGVLLDQDAGFHPFTTWSRCTTSNALELIGRFIPDANVIRIGLMRTFAVRHGPGPLPTETDDLVSTVSEHNKTNEWQGSLRYGWFDSVLTRYALNVTGGVDALMISHLDLLSRLKQWKYCIGYTGYFDAQNISRATIDSNGAVTGFNLPPYLSLDQRSAFTNVLFSVTPVIESCEPSEDSVIRLIESLLGYPIGIISRGPTAADVNILDSFPA